MRSVHVAGDRVSVTQDPKRVLTQLLSCLLEQPRPLALEPRFASGGEGFAIDGVVEARPAAGPGPYREAPEGLAEPWTVTLHRAKGPPVELVLDGSELRHLVREALGWKPARRSVAELFRFRDPLDAWFTLGGPVLVTVCCTGLAFSANVGLPFAIGTGLLMGSATLVRLALRRRS